MFMHPLPISPAQLWVIQHYFSQAHCSRPRSMERACDELFGIVKGLSAFTKGNLVQPDFRRALGLLMFVLLA
jgi:hypothetical protein